MRMIGTLVAAQSLLLAREGKGGGGVSLNPDDKISVGIFGPGPAQIVESIFADYNYGGNTKGIPVWLITYERDGEKYEQPYSVGQGWRVSSDGKQLIPKNGQTGLPDSCNAMLFLESLREAGYNTKKLGADPSVLEGLNVVLKREAQPDRGLDGTGAKKNGAGDQKKARTILLIESLADEDDAPKSKGKGSSKSKAAADDDDDEDEAPKKKKKPADDDDDEDEKPARGGKAKAKAKDDDDDDADDADGDIVEAAVEGLLEVLEKQDGPVDVDELESLIVAKLKGNPDRKKIAAAAVEPDFLAEEKGWTYNKKKGTVTLEE